MRAALWAAAAAAAPAAAAPLAATPAPGWEKMCDGGPDTSKPPNLHPIKDAILPGAVPLQTAAHGAAYHVAVDDGFDNVTLLHLHGTPYEMGRAHGELLRDAVHDIVTTVYAKIDAEASGDLPFLPDWAKPVVASAGVRAALDMEIAWTRPHTPEAFLDELRGVADGAGVSFADLYRLQLLGELTKAACSMFGMWGKATAASLGGGLLQMRAFDWETGFGLQKHSTVLVYHPEANATHPGVGHAYVMQTWAGVIFALTGMSSQRLAISQIGISCPSFPPAWGTDSRRGIPFYVMLKDILNRDAGLANATARMQGAARTCNILVGVGDGKIDPAKQPPFLGYQYSASALNVYDDKTLEPEAPWHPRIDDVVYWGMDWAIAGYDEAMNKTIRANYGQHTAEATIRNINARDVQTGNLQVAVYDFVHNQMLFANAASTGDLHQNGGFAYQRQYLRLHLDDLFAWTPSAPSF